MATRTNHPNTPSSTTTTNDQVVSIVSKLCPIMALYQVFDGFQGVSSGVLRGMGRQKRVALLNLCGFWVLGLPAGILLTFVGGFGVYSIWWGFNIGACVGRLAGCMIENDCLLDDGSHPNTRMALTKPPQTPPQIHAPRSAGLFVISILYLGALNKIDYDEEARRALENAVTDVKLKKAWEHTVDAEKEEALLRERQDGAERGHQSTLSRQ